MNLNLLSLRKLVFSATLAACGAVVLIGPAQAAQRPNSFYLKESLVGQPKVEQSDDTNATYPVILDSQVGQPRAEQSATNATYPVILDSQVGQPRAEQSATNATYPVILDSQVGQPETAPKPALPADRVMPEESSDLSDEIIFAGTLVLALFMGSAITLAVGQMRERTA
jgi:hypothetical protein